MSSLVIYVAIFLIIIFFWGIRIVRPTHRGVVERLGKYNRFVTPGFNWIIPVIDRIVTVDITEQMVDALPQEIITNDNLNATVDAQVYFKVRPDEESVKASQYNVSNYDFQIVNLARTTLRNIIGTLTLRSANSERNKINDQLLEVLSKETSNWGMEIVRTELKQIDPPQDVQETMNKVVKAENENIAALDFANAKEREADGLRRSEIKAAEGRARGVELEAIAAADAVRIKAQAEADAIKLVNESAEKYFVGNAQILKKIDATERALRNNAKVVVPAGQELVNVVGDLAGVAPIRVHRENK